MLKPLCNATIAESHKLNSERDYYLIPFPSLPLRGSVYVWLRPPADKRLHYCGALLSQGRLSAHLAA